MKIGSLFTGYGGLDMAVSEVTGGSTVWVSDIDKGACKILAHRYPDVPNLGDITQIDWASVEPVDVLTGGFPCQDVSHAGKRAGMKPGTRSGLWEHMVYAIEQLKPGMVVIENVRGLLSAEAHSDMEPCQWCVGDGQPQSALRALGAVLGDLADHGYDTRWCGLRAADVGACHGRFRVFVVAYPTGVGLEGAESERFGIPVSEQSFYSGGTSITLLPTPAVNDMGAGKTVDAWDAWTEDMQTKPEDTDTLSRALTDFGEYGPAVQRWEQVNGVAPSPTELGPRGQPRLSPRLTEWMMGLPSGWITDVPGVSWAEALKACGNGVVPQQAVAALQWAFTALPEAYTPR